MQTPRLILFLIALVLGTQGAQAQLTDAPIIRYEDTAHPEFGEAGMVSSQHALSSAVGAEILAQGGNAVDAAIAGAVLLGLCEPAMTGIGGDCFVLVKPAGTEEIIALNGSGRAPAGTGRASD